MECDLPVWDPGIPVWSGDQKTWVLALEDHITNKAIISVTPSLQIYLIFIYPLSSHSQGYWGVYMAMYVRDVWKLQSSIKCRGFQNMSFQEYEVCFSLRIFLTYINFVLCLSRSNITTVWPLHKMAYYLVITVYIFIHCTTCIFVIF